MQKYKKYIKENSEKLLFLSIAYIVLLSLTNIPYLNLYVNIRNRFLVVFVLSLFVLKLKVEHFIYFLLSLFVFAIIASLFKFRQGELAELVGNGIYALLVLWTLYRLWSHLKSIKKG